MAATMVLTLCCFHLLTTRRKQQSVATELVNTQPLGIVRARLEAHELGGLD